MAKGSKRSLSGKKAEVIAPESWVQGLTERYGRLDAKELLAAVRRLTDGFPQGHVSTGIELAALVASLEMDTTSVVAALFCRPARHGGLGRRKLVPIIGQEAARLAATVNQMADSGVLDLSSSRLLASEAKVQTDNIRRMLVAVINDGRVAALKLAERVVALRRVKASEEERKARIATEALKVFVPLAGRLGIWRLKWELEDLAFFCLEPDAYQRIAKQLASRRRQREARVQNLIGALRSTFAERGLAADIQGRAKHIYSIWQKMCAKNIPLDEVYDLHAVRVVVEEVGACYIALGLVHSLWRHVPRQFDDYIASPKENGYRSIHTAVVTGEGAPCEVQIRTKEMHLEAELGVCAHWSYKGLADDDDDYSKKVAWLRQAIAAHDREGGDLAADLMDWTEAHRVFVHTPKGHVLDLAAGATPLDFAYRVHTEVGHRCVGALVDGRPAPLNAILQSGQRVQVLTGPVASPQAAWLDAGLGYVNSSRARSKIRAWLWQDGVQREAAGKALLFGMIDSLALPLPDGAALRALAEDCGCASVDELFEAIGGGQLGGLEALGRYLQGRDASPEFDLLGDAPAGRNEPQRLRIEAKDREDLLRDLTLVLSRFGLSVLAASAQVDAQSGVAWLDMDLKVKGLKELARVIHYMRQVPDVRQVRRVVRMEG